MLSNLCVIIELNTSFSGHMHGTRYNLCRCASLCRSVWLYWGKPERAPHWLKSVMVSYIACTDCENDKIWFTSHSSLSWSHTSRVRTVRTIKYDGQAIQRFIHHVCRL